MSVYYYYNYNYKCCLLLLLFLFVSTHLGSTEEYWLGLYKVSPTVKGKTEWYDGNPSTFRKWSPKEPNSASTCIRYSLRGFRDIGCTKEYYYTCKKPAGYFYAYYSLSDTVFHCSYYSLSCCTEGNLVVLKWQSADCGAP